MKSKMFSVVMGVLGLWLVGGAGPTLSSADSLYVAANDADSVVKFDGATGALIGTFGSAGGGGRPYGLTCAPNGNLLMTREETDQVVEFDNATGALVGVFATTALNTPTGLTVGPNGNLFVANRDSGNVVEFNGTTGAFVRTFASGLPGAPFSLAFGPNGNLFVAMGFGGGGAVELNGTTGAFVRIFPTSGDPRGLTFGPNGNLFVALLDTNAVAEFDITTGALVRTFSGGLAHPHGVTFGPNGNLFVADFATGQVVEFDSASGALRGPFVTSGLTNPIELMFGPSSGPCGPLVVGIDIKPGSFPNSINPKSKGKIPVAILTTNTFDATTVDPTTVLFGATGTEAALVQSAHEDVDLDGDTDMILHFNTQDTGIVCGATSASLTGETFGGQAINGSDSINTVECK